jgi:phosphoribosylformylglycinamidine synthase
VDLEAMREALAAVREAVRSGAVACAHDVSDGGLACTLAESAIAAGIGCRVDFDPLVEARGVSGETALFGEGPGGFVLSGDRGALEQLDSESLPLLLIGEVGGETIEIEAAEQSLSVPLADAERAWRSLAGRAEPAP